MFADDFEDMVSKCVLSGFPHRMLYVFIRAAVSEEEGHGDAAGAVRILSDAHQPVRMGLTMDDVRATADARNSDWNIVVVGIAKNSDASLPSEEQAEAFLADMREKILVGEIANFAVLDRDGHPIDVEAEAVPGDGGEEGGDGGVLH